MRVLIVDDHEIVRRGVRSLLSVSPEYEICGEAVNGQDAVEKVGQLTPDVVVMDISMPKLNGLEATRQIRHLFPQTEVLMLSQHESHEMIRQAFNAGARGYVVKSSIARDLVTAIETVSRHEPFFDPSVSAPEPESVSLNAHEILQRRVALEQALRESEELYRSTFEMAAVGVGDLSLDGKILRANRKLGKILGYTPEQLTKLKYQDVTHPADLTAEKGELHAVVAGHTEQSSSETRYIRVDGSTVWVKRTVSCVRGTDRKAKHFILVVEDITDRKEAETAKFRLAAIVESSDDAIVSKDLNGIITSWNSGAQRIFGYTAQEAVGKSITLIIPPELRDEEKGILRRIRAGERIEHFETVRVSKSGKRHDISLTVSPVRDDHGNIIGASKIARDVTERKRAEEAFREQAKVLDLAQVLVRDMDSRIVLWTRGAERLYGIPASEALGRISHDLLQTKFPEPVAQIEKQLMDTGAWEGELIHRKHDGSNLVVASKWILHRDAQGLPVRILESNTDITDRKKAEAELQEGQERLRLAQAAAQIGTWEWDPAHNTSSLSSDLHRMFGTNPGGRHVEDWRSRVHPEDLQKVEAAMEEGHRSGTMEFEYRYLHPVDGLRWFFCKGRRFSARDTRMFGVLLDVTERKQAEIAQRELRKQLEERVRERTRDLEEKNAELLRHAELVRQLSARLLQSQDDERRRIARELHDSAGQIIAALQINLQRLQPQVEVLGAESAHITRESIDLVAQLSQELRTMSHLLHPPLLDEAGLASALRWYVGGYADRSRIAVDLQLSPDLGRLSREMETAIFRMVQECLTNIHRHSESPSATIRVDRSSHEVRVQVRDQGKGIRVGPRNQPSRPGVGIQGMRERIHQLGGQFEIHGEKKGTVVTAVIPIQKSSVDTPVLRVENGIAV